MNPSETQRPCPGLQPLALVEAINQGAPGSHAVRGVIDRSRPSTANDKNALGAWDDWLDSDEHADSDSDPENGSHT